MAVLVVAEVTGVAEGQDGVLARALDERSLPAGGRVRMAGPAPDGRRVVVSLWDSEADFERFREERLVPALAGTGGSVPRVRVWPV